MPYLRLVLANLVRRKLRNSFTLLTVVVAILLLGLLLPLDRLFSIGFKVADADRLIVASSSSIMQPLPLRYEQRIAELDNVDLVARFAFFGGFYQDPAQQVLTVATEPKSFISMLHEVRFPIEVDRQHWFDDPTSIAVGHEIAAKYNWKVGDLVPLYSLIYPRKDGGNSWTFKIAAIFDSEQKSGNTQSVVMHYSYFDQARSHGQGTVGWYNVRVKNPAHSEETAAAIDALFANSPGETRTATEAVFTQEFMRQVGDFSVIVTAALTAVFFTLILVAANAMAQSVNERLSEFAVLKTLGFNDRRIFSLIIAESLVLTFIGGLIGMGLTVAAIPWIRTRSEMLSDIAFWWQDFYWALAAMALVAIVSALLPALRAKRLTVIDGLARVSA
jgi:putative ABC transport system permease protein